jgi:hypothetical protein
VNTTEVIYKIVSFGNNNKEQDRHRRTGLYLIKAYVKMMGAMGMPILRD